MSTPGQRSAYIMDARQDSVYISYAHQDHEWHNRIATQLANAGISILDHPPTTREDLKASRREQAQVFVLLLSSHYFNSDEILKI
ncbi:MAG TPA: toll/interleukin-1 receptor domain-containing protein, partial [Candidatus Dormibacteraeota bacterium]|nr:toll/interleukin-1 receptor domain-containing protein [Candidatus Dormibacteraeota bacterium]